MKYKNNRKEVLIILPAYNEEENISPLLDDLLSPEISEIADVLVMNDASRDETNWIAKGKGIQVVTNVFNLGYGSSLQLGYKYAVRRGYQYVIQMDSDRQHDPCNVMDIYHSLKTKDENGEYPDIVLGSRFVENSAEYHVGRIRKFAIILFSTIIKVLTGKVVKDPTTGLQGLSWRTVLFYSKYLHFDDKYPDANMILQMQLLGFRIREIPAVMHLRTVGTSMHSGLKPIIYMFRMTVSLIAVWIRIRILKIDVGAIDEAV